MRPLNFFLFCPLALVLIASQLACRPTPTPPTPVHFRIGSADSTQYLAREAADAYRRVHQAATFEFKTSNSTMALRQLALKQIDFAFIERNPRADELERAEATALELGRDAVFVVVHPDNPLSNLTIEELQKVFSGDLNQWSQLGVNLPGSQDAIQVLAREDGSGMRAVIEEKVLGEERLTTTALLMPTNLDMLDYVSEHRNAIGYVAANIWDANSGTRTVPLNGVRAACRNVRDGSYPLLQTVFLIVPRTPGADLTAFLEFLASREGREILYRRINELPPK